jgi:hypothetical protein
MAGGRLGDLGALPHRSVLEGDRSPSAGPSTDPQRTLRAHSPSDLYRHTDGRPRDRPGSGPLPRVVACVAMLAGFIWKSKQEEKLFASQFGPAFEQHRRHTGFFLPRFS